MIRLRFCAWARLMNGKVPQRKQRMFSARICGRSEIRGHSHETGAVIAGPLKNPEKALQFAKKARELAPTDTKATAAVGAIALQFEEYRVGLWLLAGKRPRVTEGCDAFARSRLGGVTDLGKNTEAKESMESALAIEPNGDIAEDARTSPGHDQAF